MAQDLDESNWDAYLRRMANGQISPFIGAGVSPNPKGAEIARAWAEKYGYPLDDRDDLVRVAQYVALTVDPKEPRARLLEIFQHTKLPDFSDPHECHRVLADLPLPLYITTNYDPFMADALTAVGRRPKRLICDWNDSADDWNTKQMGAKSIKRWESPTPEQPWVYHLHGADVVENSMVLTEDDYLDFLAALRSRTTTMLPPPVFQALSTTCLFVGYSLADWTFRVLFRMIKLSLPAAGQSSHFALQLPCDDKEERYLATYFAGMLVKVYWGEKEKFFTELRDRWDAYRVVPA